MAFDTVNHSKHSILVKKLQHYDIDTILLGLKRYLNNTKQYVQFEYLTSSFCFRSTSVLYDLSYIIYINTINASFSWRPLTHFSDNTNIFHRNSNIKRFIKTTYEELTYPYGSRPALFKQLKLTTCRKM